MNYTEYQAYNWIKKQSIDIDWKILFELPAKNYFRHPLVLDALSYILHTHERTNVKEQFKALFNESMLTNDQYLLFATGCAGFFHDHEWMEHIPWEQAKSKLAAHSALSLASIHSDICYAMHEQKYLRNRIKIPTLIFQTTPSIWSQLLEANEKTFQYDLNYLLGDWCWQNFIDLPDHKLYSDAYMQCMHKGMSKLQQNRKVIFAFYLCVVNHPEMKSLSAEMQQTTIEKKQYILDKLWEHRAYLPSREALSFYKHMHAWLATCLNTENVLTALALLGKPGEARDFTIEQLQRVSTKKDRAMYKAIIGQKVKETKEIKGLQILLHLMDHSTNEGRQNAYRLFIDKTQHQKQHSLEIPHESI